MLDYDSACDAAVFFLVRLKTRGAVDILLTMEDIDTLFLMFFFCLLSVAFGDLFFFAWSGSSCCPVLISLVR